MATKKQMKYIFTNGFGFGDLGPVFTPSSSFFSDSSSAKTKNLTLFEKQSKN